MTFGLWCSTVHNCHLFCHWLWPNFIFWNDSDTSYYSYNANCTIKVYSKFIIFFSIQIRNSNYYVKINLWYNVEVLSGKTNNDLFNLKIVCYESQEKGDNFSFTGQQKIEKLILFLPFLNDPDSLSVRNVSKYFTRAICLFPSASLTFDRLKYLYGILLQKRLCLIILFKIITKP